MTKMELMLNFITIVLLLTTITTTSNMVTAYRIPRNDIISGTDFLTLFMNSEGSESSNNYNDNDNNNNSRQPKRIIHTITHDDSNDGILPIETMFTSKEELYGDSSNYYTHHNYRNNRKFSIDAITSSTSSSASTITMDTTTMSMPLETEILEINLETTTPRTTTETPVTSKSMAESHNNNKNNEVNKSKSEFKVLSVSVSTSVGKVHVSSSTKTYKPNTQISLNKEKQQEQDYQQQPPQEEQLKQQDSVSHLIQQKDNDSEEVHVSNSFKSELSIEEDEESTGLNNNNNNNNRNKYRHDSANGASTNIHSIVAPPISSRPEGFSLDFTYSPQQSQPRSRTQRKQDAIVPYQTVVYHDNSNANQNTKDGKGDSQQPISYSAVGQTLTQLKSWQDIDSLSPPADKNQEMKSESKSVITPKTYSEPAKVYSEPAKVYSEPAKIYSEPAKIYSEPAKIYSEPAKVYSEPAKNYGVPAKVYSQPSWQYSRTTPTTSTTATPATSTAPNENSRRIVFNELDKIPYDKLNAPADDKQKKSDLHNNHRKFVPSTRFEQNNNNAPSVHHSQSSSTSSTTSMMVNYSNNNDKNLVTSSYEIKPSNLLTPSITSRPQSDDESQQKMMSNDDSKIGYVVEGRNYRKYRVEEKTSDGFIVGEYGVVSHNDGTLRGVRYTADSDINPRLIYDALLKFLSL